MGGCEIGGSGGVGWLVVGIGCGVSDRLGFVRYGNGCIISSGCWV